METSPEEKHSRRAQKENLGGDRGGFIQTRDLETVATLRNGALNA
jgi:hypothetical protein